MRTLLRIILGLGSGGKVASTTLDPSPGLGFLIDESGNYLVDESGNKLIYN